MTVHTPTGGDSGPAGDKGDADIAPEHGGDTSASLSDRRPTEPSSQEEALLLLKGENAERADAARSAEILTRALTRVNAKNVNLFNAPVNVAGDFSTGGRRAPR